MRLRQLTNVLGLAASACTGGFLDPGARTAGAPSNEVPAAFLTPGSPPSQASPPPASPPPATPDGGAPSPSPSPSPPPPPPAPPRTLGAPCQAGAACDSGFCVEGVCCATACTDASGCLHCAVARGAEVDGQCTAAAERPRNTVDTSMPAGLVERALADGEDLGTVLRQVAPGTEIVVPAGRRFAALVLPARAEGDTRWIVVRSGAAALPPAGVRVGPGDAAALPKLEAPTGRPALATAAGAHHYRIIGFEIRPASPPSSVVENALVAIGDGRAATAAAHHVVLDRVWIHGTAGTTGGSLYRSGVEANAAYVALVDSRISEIHTRYVAGECSGGCAESKGFVAWNGPGPFRIHDNYIAAAGHNLFFGGDESQSEAMIPADIEITGNHLHKPLSWYVGQTTPRWLVKTLIELKVGRRVLIDGNYLENAWSSAATPAAPAVGHALVLSPRNGDSLAQSPWSVVEDVKITSNRIVNVGRAIGMIAEDDRAPSGQTRCVDVVNNVADRLPGTTATLDPWNDGRFMSVIAGPHVGVAHLTVAHNTAMNAGDVLVAGGVHPHPGLVFRDNLTASGELFGETAFGSGGSALERYFPGIDFRRNDLVGANPAGYGVCTDRGGDRCSFFSASLAAVGLVDAQRPLPDGSVDARSCSHERRHAIGAWDFGATGLGRAEAARRASDVDP